MRNKVSNALLEQIVNDLPDCSCGGKYQAGANPKCPHCGFELKHQDAPLERMTDPHVILLQGATFTSVWLKDG